MGSGGWGRSRRLGKLLSKGVRRAWDSQTVDWSVIPTAAIVSAAVAITIRWLDRPRPFLVATGRLVALPVKTSPEMRDTYGYPITVTNAGNGPAHDLLVVGSDCLIGVRLPKAHSHSPAVNADDRVALLAPGDSILLDVQNWTSRRESSTLLVTYTRTGALRWWRKTWSWRLADIPLENPFPAAMYEPITIPRWRQRIGFVRQYGLRQQHRRISSEPETTAADEDNDSPS